ncbi:ferredoxin--NADP reductase [Sandaracinus amylolyticus]|uniref:Phenylacetate-CoA oxygenase/reductase, PaaK subunit n=1 Tax=Sandaracinus amylolyticus TaxID=927083 RepID=A0A0F6W5R6_9BACT|nr:ferredoxin--NADP reductase [Sandaracinus amylolyticus]AKF08200.1 Phenylacetate-CoA oxygenase/reductase, PaaK subunit [Sandaracinus amylolyticus]
MQHGKRPLRSVDGIDVAASVLARLAPRALRPAIDQLRLDARSIADGFRGVREPTFSSHARPGFVPTPLAEIDPVLELLPTRALKRSYSTLRRDVEMIGRDFRGDRVPPTITRPRRTMTATTTPSLAPRRVKVTKLIRETRDAITIRLEALDGAPLTFEAGQFLTLHVPIDGAVVRRAYSLSSAPADGFAAVTCKRIEGGRVSTHLHERLREGDVLEVLGPSGTFVPSARMRRLVLIAGGSGITPCWSIARAVLARDPDAHVTLIYGNRSEADVIFGREIDALASERFRVVHVLADPSDAHRGPRGMLDRATFERIASELDIDDAEHFVCGPAPMMDAVREVLLARGVPRTRIHEERFQSPAERRASPIASPQLVTVRRRGRDVAITVPPDRTVLEAATERGVALPFSCAIGGCAACKCKVVEGEIRMDEPHCLSDAERAEGWVLTCVGHPTRPTTIEVPT